jgi:hypothetical protein
VVRYLQAGALGSIDYSVGISSGCTLNFVRQE